MYGYGGDVIEMDFVVNPYMCDKEEPGSPSNVKHFPDQLPDVTEIEFFIVVWGEVVD